MCVCVCVCVCVRACVCVCMLVYYLWILPPKVVLPRLDTSTSRTDSEGGGEPALSTHTPHTDTHAYKQKHTHANAHTLTYYWPLCTVVQGRWFCYKTFSSGQGVQVCPFHMVSTIAYTCAYIHVFDTRSFLLSYDCHMLMSCDCHMLLVYHVTVTCSFVLLSATRAR